MSETIQIPKGWKDDIIQNVVNVIPITGKKIKNQDFKPTGKLPIVDQGLNLIGGYTDDLNCKIDVVISDMAVNTTGNKTVDSLVTGELSIEALNFSANTLKKQGSFVSKIFMGSSFNEIVGIAKKKFKEVHIFKPPASRKDSKENFIICKNLR